MPDRDRYDRWCGKQRELAFLLPESLRGLVRLLALRPSLGVLTERPPTRVPGSAERLTRPPQDRVLVEPGPPVAVDRMARAKSVALDRLRGNRRSKTDQEALRRFLKTIDSGDPLLVTEGRTSEGVSVKVGDLVNGSATAASRGQFLLRASQVGYPPLGMVASEAFGLSFVAPHPPPLPGDPSFVYHKSLDGSRSSTD